MWILTKYHNESVVPIVNKTLLSFIFKVVNKTSHSCEDPLFIELNNLFSSLGCNKEDGFQLTQILTQYAPIEIITAFENNIKIHFFDYLRRFINSYFFNMYKDDIEQKIITKSELRKELYKVKNDFISGTFSSDTKYHEWIKEFRFQCLPCEFEESYYYDLEKNPQKYIKHMIAMNIHLEKLACKQFQFCPLRNKAIPKFCHIDNTTIIKLLCTKNKQEILTNISGNRDNLWNEYFNMKYINKIKVKNYVFDYGFMTDGYNASLRFIHIDELTRSCLCAETKRKGRQETKGMSKDARKKRREAKNLMEKEKKENVEKPKIKKKTKKEIKKEEFPYIDEIDVNLLKNKKFVVVDPGKRDLMTMMNEEGKFLRYSNRKKIKETKRLKYGRIIKNHKDNLGIIEIEKELAGENSKSCNLDVFIRFVKKKNELNKKLLTLYQDEKFRKIRWFSFIETKRSEAKMLDLIEETYGKDINIIHGDWGTTKQMRHYMSTPNIGIKRKLKERFTVYNIDEYHTSKLHHITEEECKKILLQDIDGTIRKKHAILTYKMENKRLGCCNRDKNACYNMRKLFLHYLETGKRLSKYSRKLETQLIKDSNQQVKVLSCQMESSSLKSAKNNYAIKII